MGNHTRYVGLDVHAATIAVAVAEEGRDGEIRSLGRIPNEPDSIRKLIKKLGNREQLRTCYEAGPCGYVLYWQLTGMGVDCEVVAPTLVPTKSGDRVKTDRRDALKLASFHRSGELTAVWVPDADHEALRDLVRLREAAKKDQQKSRLRLTHFLLRHGIRRPRKMAAWKSVHMNWLRGRRFELYALQATMVDLLAEVDHTVERIELLEQAMDQAIDEMPAMSQELVAGLQAMRGVSKLTAVTIVSELGRLSRFNTAQQLMGYSGAVPSEHSTGDPEKAKRGRITKTGNAHFRRVLVESAWTYRHRPSVQGALKRRQRGLSKEVKAIAWKAQHRLHKRYWTLSGKGKPHQKVVVAIAREMLGFIWAIGLAIEKPEQPNPSGRTRRRYKLKKNG